MIPYVMESLAGLAIAMLYVISTAVLLLTVFVMSSRR